MYLLFINTNSIKHQLFTYTYLAVLFLMIQFSKTHFFTRSLNVKNSIWRIDMTLSGATTPDERGPVSDDSEGVLCIHQSSSITLTLTIRLSHIKDPRCGESYPLQQFQPAYSTAQDDWAQEIRKLRTLYAFIHFFVLSFLKNFAHSSKYSSRKQVIFTQLYDFKYSYLISIIIWLKVLISI